MIRLLKADAKQLKGRPELDSVLRQHIQFNETTISAILPKELFAVPKLVKLSAEQIRQIEELVADKRPSFRLDKTISASGDTFALVLPDYCCLSHSMSAFGPVIGVEIKVSLSAQRDVNSLPFQPKQGFLPHESVLSVTTRLKARVCRYGLSQFHKVCLLLRSHVLCSLFSSTRDPLTAEATTVRSTSSLVVHSDRCTP